MVGKKFEPLYVNDKECFPCLNGLGHSIEMPIFNSMQNLAVEQLEFSKAYFRHRRFL